MEQFKDVHYEIQWENSEEQWAELLDKRPKTEEEIAEQCHRARAAHPGAKIRAVKVSMSVMVETISDESRTGGNPVPEAGQDGHRHERVFELLQDCD